jgi:hypothetical protein
MKTVKLAANIPSVIDRQKWIYQSGRVFVVANYNEISSVSRLAIDQVV